ncbi:hypothetical protein BGW36DRAFT_384824 [Talaromyces proteolyticus]|uniref:Uncharacterized protein n=1 Tax=Talaromyces proteolyticus TaxID=1131652 RepID=A0AAD4KIP3_9EURO|nr:uncharacterized protein BGW36DRAFT_384824 [Talaromyces proteolyticus]KAH8692614.1 hypothetical protein BGW36DRAFT_384824 [Talaromyces proteolyticus]
MPRRPAGTAGAVMERVKNSTTSTNRPPPPPLPVFSTSASYSSSLSSASNYPSSCASISPPRDSDYYISTVSPRPQRSQSNDHHSARDHLASLIRKHGPPTPVSSTSSLRKLTSTSPTNPSFFPSSCVDTPPASPASLEAPYVSTSGSQPIPIPRANPNRSLEDLPLTPLTGRFDHGLYLSERPSKNPQLVSPRHSRDEKSTRKKKTRPTASSTSLSSPVPTSRSHHTRRMPHAQGSSLTMSSQPGQVSPKQGPKDAPMYLGNLPRFHPAVYQSPNSPSNPQLSPSAANQQRSFGYRVSSGASRDALRQYRELVAASVSLPRNSMSGNSEISAPRLDPLGSPGPVTPLALEEADSYIAARSGAPEDKQSKRQSEMVAERERVVLVRGKDGKGR